jgi:hypothetical protein
MELGAPWLEKEGNGNLVTIREGMVLDTLGASGTTVCSMVLDCTASRLMLLLGAHDCSASPVEWVQAFSGVVYETTWSNGNPPLVGL